MDRLWAPWRLTYVQQIREEGCFLCRAFSQTADRDNLVLKRGLACGIVMNRYPYNNGHLLICPYRHVADLPLLTPDERRDTMDLLCECAEALRAAVRPHGFNVGINLGRAAGAGLEEHVHAHIVPRWEGDTSFMPVTADVKVIPQLLLELWDRLHPLLNR
jgi:ATP adenylyltransferase